LADHSRYSTRAKSLAGILSFKFVKKPKFLKMNRPVQMSARSGPVFDIEAAVKSAK
jgi:hypothetical protein